MIPQIFTERVPFHELSDARAVLAISQAKKPNRPDLNAAELPDKLWKMMERCWDSERDNRPDADWLLARRSSWSS